jgi:hypothetical protein
MPHKKRLPMRRWRKWILYKQRTREVQCGHTECPSHAEDLRTFVFPANILLRRTIMSKKDTVTNGKVQDIRRPMYMCLHELYIELLFYLRYIILIGNWNDGFQCTGKWNYWFHKICGISLLAHHLKINMDHVPPPQVAMALFSRCYRPK